MRIKNLLDKVHENQSLKSQQLKFEENELNKIYKGKVRNSIDINIYLQLLPLMAEVCKQEQFYKSEIEREKLARIYASKLTIVFVTYEACLKYLKRYEEQIDENQSIYKACSFKLPLTDEWNVNLWREIISNNKPNKYDDLILRLLPFADNIEKYIKDNYEQLIANIRLEILCEFETKFIVEYEGEIEKEFFSKVRELADKKFNFYLRKKLNISNGKLTDYDIDLIKNRKSNLTNEDKEEFTKIREKIELGIKRKKELSNNIIKNNLPREQYIDTKIKDAKNTIAAITNSKAKALLSPRTPLSILLGYARTNLYSCAKENPTAAELFFRWGLSEDKFNLYLSLKPNDEGMPNLELDMSSISHPGFYVKKLSSHDPKAAILGKLTSCCQALGLQGEKSTIYGIEEKTSGFYVLYQNNDGKDAEIIAQCWAWQGKDGAIVFDSIETHLNFRKMNNTLVSDSFIYLADQLVKKCGIPRVLVGLAGGTPRNLNVLKALTTSYPANYERYDSHTQCIIADKYLPMIDFYLGCNEVSNLGQIRPNQSPMQVNSKTIKEWCDLYVLNKNELLKSHINTMSQFNDTRIIRRINRTLKWIDFIDTISIRTIKTEKIREKLLRFIKHGVNLNLPNKNGEYLLHIAVLSEQKEIVKKLLGSHADINIKNRFEQTILHLAAENDRWSIVEEWCNEKHIEINSKDSHGQNILHLAAQNDKWDLVFKFIKIGGDINAKDSQGLSLLSQAMEEYPRNWILIMRLLSEGADIKTIDGHQRTVLHHAASDYKPNIIRTLLLMGADINSKDQNGMTAMHLTANSGELAAVDLLIKLGADVNTVDKNGNNALINTVQRRNLDIAEVLVSNNANVNVINNCGVPVLHFVCCYGELALINLFFERGCDSNITDSRGKTALHDAVDKQNLAILDILLRNGANVDAKDNKGRTALHCAARKTNLTIVKELLKAGADLAVEDYNNLTPLAYAKNKSKLDLFDLELIDYLTKKTQEPKSELMTSSATLFHTKTTFEPTSSGDIKKNKKQP